MSFSIILTEKGGATQRLDFECEEITIGRVDENDICLPKGNISKKHTKIVVKDGKIIVLDLKSTNGTYVNGKKLAGPQVITPADKVYVGDFIISVEPPDMGEAPLEEGEEGSTPTMTPQQLEEGKGTVSVCEGTAETLNLVDDRLIEAMDLRRVDVDSMASEELWKKTESTIRQLVTTMDQTGEIDAHVGRDELVTDVLNEALGLGPLEIYLSDESISEIMVNSPTQVYVEREGKLMRVDKAFSSPQAVLGVIERIVAPLGRHIDESSPLVDARLSDGSRVNAIIPPLALNGPCITIRKFKRDLLSAENLIDFGTLTPQMADFLDTCVKVRRNIVIPGGTGPGKTTLLNILSSYIPDRKPIGTIENAGEPQLPQAHWVQLEAPPANSD